MQDILNDNVDEKNSEANFITWYEEVVVERLAMLENEERYKKRIKELEQNNAEMTKALQESQNEIRHLRNKYEPQDSDELYNEPYKVILKEKEKLAQRGKHLDNEVSNLKDELKTLREYVKGLETGNDKHGTSEAKTKSKKAGTPGYIVVTGEETIASLEDENDKLKDKIELLENKLAAQSLNPENTWSERQPVRAWKTSPNSDTSDTYLPKVFETRSSDSSLDSYEKRRQASLYAESKGKGDTSSRTNGGSVSSRLSDVTLPSIHEGSRTPRLLYGLDYVTIHKLKTNGRKSRMSKSSNASYT